VVAQSLSNALNYTNLIRHVKIKISSGSVAAAWVSVVRTGCHLGGAHGYTAWVLEREGKRQAGLCFLGASHGYTAWVPSMVTLLGVPPIVTLLGYLP